MSILTASVQESICLCTTSFVSALTDTHTVSLLTLESLEVLLLADTISRPRQVANTTHSTTQEHHISHHLCSLPYAPHSTLLLSYVTTRAACMRLALFSLTFMPSYSSTTYNITRSFNLPGSGSGSHLETIANADIRECITRSDSLPPVRNESVRIGYLSEAMPPIRSVERACPTHQSAPEKHTARQKHQNPLPAIAPLPSPSFTQARALHALADETIGNGRL